MLQKNKYSNDHTNPLDNNRTKLWSSKSIKKILEFLNEIPKRDLKLVFKWVLKST